MRGSSFGHDMVLEADHLRDTMDAIALTFSQVQALERKDLFDVIKDFPIAARLTRRYAFKLAFRRAVVAAARQVKDGGLAHTCSMGKAVGRYMSQGRVHSLQSARADMQGNQAKRRWGLVRDQLIGGVTQAGDVPANANVDKLKRQIRRTLAVRDMNIDLLNGRAGPDLRERALEIRKKSHGSGSKSVAVGRIDSPLAHGPQTMTAAVTIPAIESAAVPSAISAVETRVNSLEVKLSAQLDQLQQLVMAVHERQRSTKMKVNRIKRAHTASTQTQHVGATNVINASARAEGIRSSSNSTNMTLGNASVQIERGNIRDTRSQVGSYMRPLLFTEDDAFAA